MKAVVERAFLIALGVLVGIFLAKMEWATFLVDDWETLVTGCLAVAAALYTVNQMRSTETAQERRHSELLRLNLRDARLKAERAANPLAQHLLKTVEFIDQAILRGAGLIEGLFHGDRVALDDVDHIAGVTEFIDKEPAFAAVSDLMDGNMAFNLRVLRNQVDLLKVLLSQTVEFPSMERRYSLAKAQTIATQCREIRGRLVTLSHDLTALADEYNRPHQAAIL